MPHANVDEAGVKLIFADDSSQQVISIIDAGNGNFVRIYFCGADGYSSYTVGDRAFIEECFVNDIKDERNFELYVQGGHDPKLAATRLKNWGFHLLLRNIEGKPLPIEVTETSALTSMCIWEAALEEEVNGDKSVYEWLTQEQGAWQGRQNALSMAPKFDALHAKVEAEFDQPFDWEFVPAVLRLLADKRVPIDFDICDQLIVEIRTDLQKSYEHTN